MQIDWRKAAFSFGSVVTASVAGTLLGGDQKAVYLSLVRPGYAPPPIVFPIVWSALYLLMGYALYAAITARQAAPYSRRGMTVTFELGLLLSALWPMVFFRFQLFTLAFFIVVAMIALGVFTAIDFSRVSRRAALCYLPYLCWLTFALFLNHAVARLNG